MPVVNIHTIFVKTFFPITRVIGIDGLMVCILYGEISVFDSRVMGKKVYTNIVWTDGQSDIGIP
jgi:hypothetical protein